MAEAAIPLMAVGTIVSASSTIAGGQAQSQYAQAEGAAHDYTAQADRNQAEILRVQAGQERAASQRDAARERRNQRLLESRAQAVAAASGGGASDPTVTKVISDIAGEGTYRALGALYTGEDKARGLEAAAYDNDTAAGLEDYKSGLSGWESKLLEQAAGRKALATIIGGGASIASKYN